MFARIHINNLKPAEYNPRMISDEDYEKLKKSIREFGLVDPIIVNLKNNTIIGGHQRYKVLLDENITDLKLLRMGDIGYVFQEKDLQIESDIHEKGLNLALNNINGEFVEEKLQPLLEEVNLSNLDIEVTGFDKLDLEDFKTPDIETESKEITEDNYEDPIEKIETNIIYGDRYKLGNHYLFCGDATNKEDLNILLNTGDSIKIDSVVTDPPYGVDYNNKNEFLNQYDQGKRIQKEIQNDNITDYQQFFKKILENIKSHFNEYNTLYIFMSSKELHNLRLAIENIKDYHWGDYLVWVKNNHILGRKDYNAKHEFVLYGWYKKHKFYGGFSTTILEFDKPLKNDLHPTMKPISLLSKLITDGTPKNGVVLDLFGGSGSTLIACEQLNRNCYMMEIEPKYCQTIINRWEDFTGQKAQKIN